MKRVLLSLIAVIMIGSSMACNTAGPRGLKSGVVAYNQAVAQTKGEQLLLNLVRLRYRDLTSFLEVSSISSQYQFTSSAGLSFGLKRPSGDTSYGGATGLSFSEKPTFSLNPLRGEAFVTQMMSPMAPEIVTILFHSGWNFDRVARLVIQGINGVDNAPTASGPTPALAPEFSDFKRVTELLRIMQKRNELELGTGQEQGRFYFRIDPSGDVSAEMKEIQAILDLPTGQTQYEVLPSVLKAPSGKISISMRSLNGVFYLLSQGVEVPSEHEQQGLVTVTMTKDGQRFDWLDVTGDLLRIRWSKAKPDNAAVRVEYRGHWFYIADNDLTSKSTFSLLNQVAALQAGGVPSNGPVLTLPLG